MTERMRRLLWALAVLVAACGGPSTHWIEGDVVKVEPAGFVTVAHDGIPGVLPAKRSRLRVEPVTAVAGLVPGAHVRMAILHAEGALTITSIEAVEAPRFPAADRYDHAPRHGGVVTMVGLMHVEALADRDGTITLHLSDRFRVPRDPAGWVGTVAVGRDEGAPPSVDFLVRERTLVARARGPFEGPAVDARVQLKGDGETFDLLFVLPLAGGEGAAAPTRGCVAVAPAEGKPSPRCVLRFEQAIPFVAVSPKAPGLITGVHEVGISRWMLPSMRLAASYAMPPQEVAPSTHADDADAIAVRSDGTEMAVAISERLLMYDVASGAFRRELPQQPALVHRLAFVPGTDRLAVLLHSESFLRLLAPEGGEERRLAADGPIETFAFGADGSVVALAVRGGPIALVDVATGTTTRVLEGVPGTVEGVTLVDAHVVSVGPDAVLRVWERGTGERVLVRATEARLLGVTASPDGKRVAVVDADRVVRVIDLATGTTQATLEWHTGRLTGLAWTGDTIVTTDAEGALALWNAPG